MSNDLKALTDEALTRELDGARANLRGVSRRGTLKAIDAAMARVRELEAELKTREVR